MRATAEPTEWAEPSSAGRVGTFAALRVRNFRLLLIGTTLSNAGQWIQQVTLGWLVYELTGSGTALGTINLVRSVAALGLAPVAGSTIDRVGRRRLMLAINGWLLLQGQIPLAAARDRLFPEAFGRVSKFNTPAFALVFSSILASILMVMNYNKSLVQQFTFIILLATLNTLVPYTFCTMSEIMMYIKDPARFSGKRLGGGVVLSLAAFAYSLWAIAGAGQEIVYWGFIFLMAGVPVYVWIRSREAAAA